MVSSIPGRSERRVWEVRYVYVRGNPRYRGLLLAEEPDLEWSRRLEELLALGRPLSAEWRPVRVEYDPEDLPLGDFAELSDLRVLVLSHRARAALEPILGPHAEFLPLAGVDMPYFIYNCLRRIDPFDHHLSKVQVETFQASTGEVYRCFKAPNWRWSLELYEFDETRISNVDVFALPGEDLVDLGSAGLYVSDRVVDAICAARLTGLEFLQVWPREGRGTIRTSVPAKPIPERRSGKWRERVRKEVLQAGWTSVVLEREAVENQSGTLALDGHRAMVLRMLESGLSIWELPPASRLAHVVDDFWTEYLCGGFSQFVFNTHWDRETVSLVHEGLSRIGQKAYLRAFEKAVEYVEQMEREQLEAFLEGEYFGDETAKELNALDKYFEQARKEKGELNVLLGQWLLAQKPQVALEPWEITGWVQYRVSCVRKRRRFRRAAERTRSQPVYVPFCRSLLKQAIDREVVMIIGTEKLTVRGEPHWGWRVLADDGRCYWRAELPSGALALLDEEGGELSVGEISVPHELGHRELLR